MALSIDLRSEIARADTDPNFLLFNGVPLPEDDVLWSILGGDFSQYEAIERNGHVSAVLGKRQFAITSRDWEVKPSGKSKADIKAAEIVKEILELIKLDNICLSLSDALLKGFAVGELMWNQIDNLNIPQFIPKPQHRFSFKYPEFQNDNFKVNGYELRVRTRANSYQGEPVGDRKFLVYSFGSKSGNPWGCGLGNKLYWPVKFLKEDVKAWLIAMDKFASPTPSMTYPANGNKTQAEAFLRDFIAGGYAALPQGYVLAFHQAAQAGGYAAYERLAGYCNSEISKAVLGETLTTEIGGVGSYAAADTHNEVREELAKADADLLHSGPINQLCQWITELNVPGAKPPTCYRVFPEDAKKKADEDKAKADTRKSQAESFQILIGLGFKPSAEEVKNSFGEGWTVEDTKKPVEVEQFKESDRSSVLDMEIPISKDSLEFRSVIDSVLKWNGLSIGIEHLPGAVRFPKSKHAKKLRSAYGHIRGYKGSDKEALDCYISPDTLDGNGSARLFEVSQLDSDGEFDELKIMIGYPSLSAATEAYLQEMPEDFLGGIRPIKLQYLEKYKKVDKSQFAAVFAQKYEPLLKGRSLAQIATLTGIPKTKLQDGFESGGMAKVYSLIFK